VFKSKLAQRCVAAIALLAVSTQLYAAAPSPSESAAWSTFVNNYVEATFKAQPFFAVYAGRHEFDGQMPDLSAAGIDAEIMRLRGARRAALAIDAADMSDPQKFERDYLVAVIDNDLFWYSKAEFPFRNPAWYVQQLDPDIYLSRAYASLDQRMRGYIGYAEAIPVIAVDVRKNLRTPMPRTFVEYAVKALGASATSTSRTCRKFSHPFPIQRCSKNWLRPTMQRPKQCINFATGSSLSARVLTIGSRWGLSCSARWCATPKTSTRR
jgi:hypothetical protein